MSPKKSIRWTLVLGTVVLAGGVGSWMLLHGHSGQAYRTIPAAKGDLLLTVAATGAPNAVVTVQVGSQVSGNVLALYADFNSKVTKGQLIARIDPEIFEARVRQANASVDAARVAVANAQAQIQARQAEVAAAKANLAASQANVMRAQASVKDAKYKYDRRMALSKDLILSAEDLETAQATYDTSMGNLDAAKAQVNASDESVRAAEAQVVVAKALVDAAQAQVRQSQANLAQAQTDLDHTYIHAPVDGTVIARHVDVGQTVAASLQAPTLFEIAQDLTKMQVDTNVSEADVGKVEVGQAAMFSVDAYPGRVFHGSVREVRKAPLNIQNVITYDVVVAVDNTDLSLYPGMTASVKIVTGRRDGVLRVSNAALRFTPLGKDTAAPGRAGGQRGVAQAVYVLSPDGGVRAVAVSIGATDGTWSEVTGGGLKAGDSVVVAQLAASDQSSSASSVLTPRSGGAGPRGRPF